MNLSSKLLPLVSTLLLVACGGSTDPIERPDGGGLPEDAGQRDAGQEDAGQEDAGSTPADGGTEDAGSQTPPRAPTLTGTEPSNLGSEPRPLVLGTAEPGVTVDLYNSFVCSGAALATGTVGEDGRFAIPFPVTPNGSAHITAKVRRGTLASECSSTSASYTHDDRVPRVDSVTPARDATGVSLTAAPVARFSESMNAGSVMLDVTCGGQPVTGSLAVSGNQATFTPGASLPEQVSCTVTVREGADLAGNTLAAEYAWSFTTLRVPNPNPPTFTGTTPASPGTSTTPSVSGRATVGLTVELFTTSDCSGTAVASGTASASGTFSLPVTVPANSATTFRAQAVDSGGRRSTCSSASVSYVHDSVAPTVLSATPAPDATGVLRSATVRVTLSETVRSVSSGLTLTCGGQGLSGSTSFSGAQVTFTPSGSLPYDLSCTATLAAGAVTDVAGNALAAAYSWSFEMQPSPAPNTPSLVNMSPASPGRSLTPNVNGGATPGLTVELFTTSDCSGTAVANGTSNANGSFSIPVTVTAHSTTVFRAQARNATGRRSACSTQSLTYVHDDVAPTVASTRPAPDAVDVEANTPVAVTFSEPVKNTSGTLTVQCGGASVQGSLSASSTVLTFTPTQPLPLDVSCTARVSTLVTDLAGNPLAAAYSWSFTMKDSPPPGPPALTGTTPTSPGNSPTPTVSGTATAGHTIELYLGEDCGGTPVASGIVSAQGRFSIPVTVATNATTHIRATARLNSSRPSSPCTPQALVYRHDGVAPTVTQVGPLNDATDVQPDATLTVDFSELITAQTGDVELRCGGTLLPGTVSVAERRLTFAPAVQLWLEEACTVTVRTGVRDLAGNALADAYSWGFTTRPYGWGPGPVVATASGNVTNVEVGLDNAGNATLVWRGGTSPAATTRHHLNPQQGVSTGLQLNTASSETPVVGTSPNGHAIIAWFEEASREPTRLLASVYMPGTGWTTPATLVSSSDLNPHYPQVAIDNSGQALVVFRQHATHSTVPYSLYARRFVPGSGWQPLTEIDGLSDWIFDVQEPSVTRDGRGGFLVVWSGEYNPDVNYRYYLFYNRLVPGTTPGSASWSGARYFRTELNPRTPRAGCDAQGNCIVVYGGNNNATAKAMRYDAATQDWGTPITLGPGSNNTHGVNVAVNANGQAVAAFTYSAPALSDYDVMVRQYEPGTGWSDPVSIGPVPAAGLNTGLLDVGIDAQGNASVLSRQGSPTRLYASRYRLGVGWAGAEELDNGIGWSSGGNVLRETGARVAMNASGQTLVVYWKGNSVYARWLQQ